MQGFVLLRQKRVLRGGPDLSHIPLSHLALRVQGPHKSK